MKDKCHIVICGDLCPTPDTEALFTSGNAKGLFKDLLTVFQDADFLVGNLECALTDIGKGIAKCGPVLSGKKDCISVLKAAGFDLLGLANNHIRDCGDEGVLSTIECCHKEGILTVGAGENATAAKKPVIVEVEGWKIGVMAFAEHEFNAASEGRAGANLLDVFYSLDEIRDTRTQCDYLIVLYHGGIEYYVYPSPMLQKKCRKMVESGADIVLCQHSHCVGTTESYNGGTILYGQGNTVFGYRPNSPDWNEGLIVTVSLSKDTEPKATVEYLPILADTAGVDLVPLDRAEPFLDEFFKRSRKIADREFLHNSWQRFCKAQKADYLPLLLGLGRVLNYLNRILQNRVVMCFFSRKRMRNTMNLMRCEAHNEVIRTVLQEYTEDDQA